MKCSFELNSKGYLKQRESFDLEFKQAFHYGDSLLEYLRSLVGMANNKGGELIFGIKDSPRVPLGLTNEKFDNCDPNKISQAIAECFSQEIDWHMETIEHDGKSFGRLWVDEAKLKPIVCRKTHKNILREAAVYYRYRGETREVRYPELQAILEAEREKEKKLWLRHIEKIGQVGPQHIHLIDTYNGEIQTGSGKILLDKEIAKELKFIKEGQFSETEGAPTLKLVGEVTGVVDTTHIPRTDVLYPYRFNDLKDKFGLNSHQIQAILWKLEVKGNPRYHTEIATSKAAKTHKYSEAFIDKLEALFKRYTDWIENTTEEFNEYRKLARSA